MQHCAAIARLSAVAYLISIKKCDQDMTERDFVHFGLIQSIVFQLLGTITGNINKNIVCQPN
jgi:hypothetical protein